MYAVMGRDFWFAGGEWAFLTTRSIRPHDLLRNHLGHFVAIPTLEYRALFQLVGIHAYWPYEYITIGMHLAAAALLRTVMRRCDVNPWIATAAAGLFLFFGAGAGNILWAFQVTLTGALVFGMVQLLSADHDGGIQRRDWYGLAAGAAALACSGVALSAISVVGVAVFMRRGWRAASFHVLPLAGIYVLWSRIYNDDVQLNTDPGLLVRWVVRGYSAGFHAVSQSNVFAWVLVSGTRRRTGPGVPFLAVG